MTIFRIQLDVTPKGGVSKQQGDVAQLMDFPTVCALAMDLEQDQLHGEAAQYWGIARDMKLDRRPIHFDHCERFDLDIGIGRDLMDCPRFRTALKHAACSKSGKAYYTTMQRPF